MLQDMWWIWIAWATGAAGSASSCTYAIHGLGGRSVVAEASLSKEWRGGGPGYAYATVWHALFSSGSSINWGMYDAPIRWLSGVNQVTFGLEVGGPWTFAWMTGKVFIF